MVASGPVVSEQKRPVVALVSDAIYPYFCGGKELRYYELARRLAANATVDVYTMHWWEGPRRHTDGAVTFHAISRLRPMYVGNRRSFPEAIFFALGCLRLLWCHFDALDADQFPHFHVLTLRLVTWIKRKPLSVTWHEVWEKSYWREYLGWAGYLAWAFEWLVLHLPDNIIAASPQTAARLRVVLGPQASITVAPNGIDLEAICSSYPDAAPTDLIVVGRLIEHKRVGMLLDALALLHAEGLPITCRVIGDGPERLALHERARTLGVDHAVDFRHDVREQKDIYSLMKAAKIAVFPTAREGFGIAALEAIACGLPVITTSAPDNLARHLVEQSARGVVCEQSAVAIASAVRRMLEDLDARARDGHAQDQSLLAQYSWAAVTGQVAQALQI